MADKKTVPDWLANHPKFEYWEVFDPRVSTLDETRVVFEQIKNKVMKLIEAYHGEAAAA